MSKRISAARQGEYQHIPVEVWQAMIDDFKAVVSAIEGKK